jgi:hypothetical protein
MDHTVERKIGKEQTQQGASGDGDELAADQLQQVTAIVSSLLVQLQ